MSLKRARRCLSAHPATGSPLKSLTSKSSNKISAPYFTADPGKPVDPALAGIAAEPDQNVGEVDQPPHPHAAEDKGEQLSRTRAFRGEGLVNKDRD